jgi:hypothetical protein
VPAFNNLSELGNHKLNQMPSTTAKFSFPKLNLVGETSSLSNTSNLSEYANLQLKNYQQKDSNDQKFVLPNIFSSKPSFSPFQNPIIDLKSALLSENEKKEIPKEINKVPKEKSKESFIPKFIDCDIASVSKASDNFDIDKTVISSTTLQDLLREKVAVNEPSMLGKIIGKRFNKKVPYIRHSYEMLKEINRFKFDIPSPDDQILAHLKKKK